MSSPSYRVDAFFASRMTVRRVVLTASAIPGTRAVRGPDMAGTIRPSVTRPQRRTPKPSWVRRPP